MPHKFHSALVEEIRATALAPRQLAALREYGIAPASPPPMCPRDLALSSVLCARLDSSMRHGRRPFVGGSAMIVLAACWSAVLVASPAAAQVTPYLGGT
jgi:hypothetical protein